MTNPPFKNLPEWKPINNQVAINQAAAMQHKLAQLGGPDAVLVSITTRLDELTYSIKRLENNGTKIVDALAHLANAINELTKDT